MNTLQKVIKYLALAFAIFLTVSIVGGILVNSGFIGHAAKDAVGVYPDIDACRNKNIDASKDGRYLNSTVFFNNSFS